AYSLPELAPDVIANIGIIQKLMIADMVTKVGSENGADTYRIGIVGEEALSLLTELVPDLADRLSAVNEAYLTITVQEKALTGARIDASGRFKEGVDVNISVALSDTPVDNSYAVSEDLISRVRNMKRRDGVKLLRDLFRFYVSWSRFEAADPRAANVVIGAKCGLLNFKTSFDWCGRLEDGNWVDYFIKDGKIVYQTVNDAAEENASAESQTMVIAVKLFGLAYELCRQDSGGYTEQDGKYIYSAELSEEMMDLILSSVFPSAQRMNVTLTSGNMELVLGDYVVDSVSLNIEGTVRVLVFDLPVEVNAVLTVVDNYDLPD
ncbi:MAG: hypothetical protein IKD62_08495, partial [Oscillospiraceae bacterium]|nr:hypothetical protein [Oscillospiraceae bacterium]